MITVASRLARLLREIEMGDARSFMEIIEELEDKYRKSMYLTNTVDTGELALVRSCTYILLDRINHMAHVLLGDEERVVSFEVPEDARIEEISDSICTLLGDDEDLV
jgi:hypothetical protein